MPSSVAYHKAEPSERRPRRREAAGHRRSKPDAVIKNQDDDGGQDSKDDRGGKLRWLVTARHVDTSVKARPSERRRPLFNPVRPALILARPWDSTSAKWRTGAARPRSRKRLRAAPLGHRSSRI